MHAVAVSDAEAILLVFFSSREHVRPYLAGPVQRSVGEVVLRG